MDENPEARLVRKAQRGDVDAFAELVLLYRKRIFQTILMMTRNISDADDLAQETFMQAFKALKSFKQQSSFFTWVYRIAVNRTLNFLKKKTREGDRMAIEPAELPQDRIFPGDVSMPEQNSLRKELKKTLQNAIDSLPPPYKMTFLLVELQRMPHEQAARILRCTENTVSWRMHRARKMLREILRPYLQKGKT